MSHAPDFSRIAAKLRTFGEIVQGKAIERALVRAWRKGVKDGKVAAFANVEAAIFKSKAHGLDPVSAVQVVLAITRAPVK